MLFALLKGFSASGSLIIAIGAQNAFVIRQGLRRQHLFVTASLCAAIDAILIVLGIMGFGNVLSSYPIVIDSAKYFAVVFLVIYGALSLKSAFQKNRLECPIDEQTIDSLKKTILTLLALSLLNPHVYLDTVILLGSIASQHPSQEQIFFGIGAIVASFTWFFSITYGARLLTPFFQKENSWKIIDMAIAFIMWAIAWTLFKFI